MVPRETLAPPAPPVALDIFGPSLPLAERFATLLARVAVERGLLGPREVPRIWDRHLLNCAVVAPALASGATVCDVGSGAGLPGLVWALVRPDLHITLLEPSLRRVQFLTEAVADLELRHVEVVRGRADGTVGFVRFDVVTGRAVSSLEKLARLALPLCRPGGGLLAFKGKTAQAELAVAEPALRRLGATAWRIQRWGDGVLDPATTVIYVQAAG